MLTANKQAEAASPYLSKDAAKEYDTTEKLFRELDSGAEILPIIRWEYPTDAELRTEVLTESDVSKLVMTGKMDSEYNNEISTAAAVETIKQIAKIETLSVPTAFKSFVDLLDRVKSYGGRKYPETMVEKIYGKGVLPMPIVLRHKNGSLEVIAGRTRAGLASLAGQKVKALVLDKITAHKNLADITIKEFKSNHSETLSKLLDKLIKYYMGEGKLPDEIILDEENLVNPKKYHGREALDMMVVNMAAQKIANLNKSVATASKDDLEIVWKKPVLEDEMGEYFENDFTTGYFKKNGVSFKTEKDLLKTLEQGELVAITRSELSSKYENLTLEQEDFEQELKDPEYSASFNNMQKILNKNKKLTLPAPIIFKFGDIYYGFAGNRRTNLAFSNGIPLKVWLVKINKTKIVSKIIAVVPKQALANLPVTAVTNDDLNMFIDIAGKSYQSEQYLMSKEADGLWEDEQLAAPDVWEDREEWAKSQEREAYESGDPSVHFDTARELPAGTWLVHFTDSSPYDILRTGFKGRDVYILGLTTHYGRGSHSGSLALAFAANRLRPGDMTKYGKNAVLFQAKESAMAYHYGDEENQVVFPVEAAYNLWPIFDIDGDLELTDPEGDNAVLAVGRVKPETIEEFVSILEKKKIGKKKKIESSTSLPFFSDCIGWPSPYADALRIIRNDSKDISRSDFLRHVSPEDIQPKKDWAIWYKRFGQDVYFYIDSGVEYIYAQESTIEKIQNDYDESQDSEEDTETYNYLKKEVQTQDRQLRRNFLKVTKNIEVLKMALNDPDDLCRTKAKERLANLSTAGRKIDNSKKPVAIDVEIRETEGRIPIEDMIGTRKTIISSRVVDALTKVIALRNRDNDPLKSDDAIAFLEKIQSEIPAAINEFRSGTKKKDMARALCYDMANVIMEDWFRYYFK